MMASATTMAYTPPTPTQPVAGGGGGGESPPAGGSEESDALLSHHLELPRAASATNGTRAILKRTFSDAEAESPKKRRKQSTPVKIPTTCQPEVEAKAAEPAIGAEGKPETHTPSSPAPPNSTPSPNLFPTSKSVDENPANVSSPPIGITTSLPPNLHPDIFKMDFGSIGAPWMTDIQNKAEEWLSSTPLHNVPFSFPPLQSPGINNQLSPFPMLDSSQQSSHLLSRPINQPRIRIFNPDAYCDLCNKEFCNKYFLKTHKANKHGIYSDLPPTELSLPAPSTSSKPLPSNPSTAEQPPQVTTPLKSLDATPKALPNLLAASCDICQKKFCNKNFVKRHKVKAHGIIDDTDTENDSTLDQNVSDSNSETPTPQRNTSPSANFYPEGLPECLKPFLDPEFEPENIQYRWPIVGVQSPSLNQQVREAIHRPRGLGIVNPEAFCEICCKEYCNKYFLRTHKMKRHGIMMPEDAPKETNVPSVNRTMQTSPLNLIMSEQTNSSESYADKKDIPTDDILVCIICGVHVSQRYMKAHYEACHPDKNHQAVAAAPAPTTTSPIITTIKEEINLEAASNDKPGPNTDENISEDLKKLQTMILQLNNLNVCQIVSCNVCGKEFENKFYLQAHMMSEHGALYMKITDEKLSIQNTSVAPTATDNLPKITDSKLFNNDVAELPRTAPQPTPIPENVNINTKTYVQSVVNTNERRPSVSLAPTNSYCEICNKELCNKYFMKTHMQRMHGIEIENGSQIGGVVCNICNKELCSKYFLRVHKHNTHGIVEDGVPLPQARQNTEEATQSNPSVAAASDQHHSYPSDTALKPNELGDLNHRYFAHFTEVCPICSRRFRSTKWLKAHLLTDHGKAEHDKWEDIDMLLHKQTAKQIQDGGQKHGDPDNGNISVKVPNGGPDDAESKIGIQSLLSNIFGPDELNSKKYYCSYAFCNFSTPVLAFLFVHERSHGQTPVYKGDSIFQCFICNQNLQSTEELQQHLVIHHANIAPKQFYKSGENNNATAKGLVDAGNTRQSDVEKSRGLSPVKIKEESNGNDVSKGVAVKSGRLDGKSGDARRSIPSDLSQTLFGVSQQMQLPTMYALPQLNQEHGDGDQDSKEGKADEKYVMQPFLIEECAKMENLNPSAMGVQLRLVPSLVFLPVREKITTPLTTSIKLTPT